MQIAKLLRTKALIGMDSAKQAFRFEPMVFGWCQDGMTASKAFDKRVLGRPGRSTTRSCCDSLLVAAPVRRWSMKIEVSKTTKLLIVSREFKLPAVFRHQLHETLQGNNFTQRRVYRLGSRFHA